MNFLKRYIEYGVVGLFHYGFWILPLNAASAVGGWLGRFVGAVYAPLNRTAKANLRLALPQLNESERQQIVTEMWTHFGRLAAEYSHLKTFAKDMDRIEIVGREWAELVRDDGKPGLFFSAHLGHWEMAAIAIKHLGVPVIQVYRAANNPRVNSMIRQAQHGVTDDLIQKGPSAGRELLRVLKDGKHVMMMVDQKMNNGIPVPFFGHPAMTAPALAKLALHFRCPLVPVRVERTGRANFRVTFYPPLAEVDTLPDTQEGVLTLMTLVNKHIEQWIRERPSQWLWVHRRWS